MHPDDHRTNKSFFRKAVHALRPVTQVVSNNSPHLRSIAEHASLSSFNEKASLDHEGEGRDRAFSTIRPGDNLSQSPTDIAGDNIDRRRNPRHLPPGIPENSTEYGEEDLETTGPTSYLLPNVPKEAKAPEHLFIPSPKPGAGHGRKYDQYRDWHSPIIDRPFELVAPRWEGFTGSATPKLEAQQPSALVGDEWKAHNLGDLMEPWKPPSDMGGHAQEETGFFWLFSDRQRSATFNKWHTIVMRNPFIPLILRLTVMAFTITALAVGVTIYEDSDSLNSNPAARASTTQTSSTTGSFICEQKPSTYMSFIVGSCAVIYLFYITWDEYFSKPLGLRRGRDKVRLLFFDLFFIIFSSANLSLAFNTLTDRQWACFTAPVLPGQNANNSAVSTSTCIYDRNLCDRQRALVGILTAALFIWLQTFTISILRVIERMSR